MNEKNMEYMERQSSRAEITPWAFDNEYHYGDFHGNAKEMLRRGYGLYLHYANFGTRRLWIHFPKGLPDAKAAKPYLASSRLKYHKDKEGPGGILAIEPFYEPGDLEELWDINELADRLVPLRAEILGGDLRPLYLAHLATACDCDHDPDETTEGPVPAGMGELTNAQCALAELYELDDQLIAAAAQASPPLPAKVDVATEYGNWLHDQPEARKNAWLASIMADHNSSTRAEMIATFRKQRGVSAWPTVQLGRTIAQLEAAAEELTAAANRKAAAHAERKRAKRLADMAADPTKTLRETESLVAQRTTKAYSQAGEMLAELHEALASTGHQALAQRQAEKLRQKFPTARGLVSELRQRGLLQK